MGEYIVSARKYRPMSFDSVVGQSALTTTLKNAVKTGKLAHAYLFCGPRGVGKTTCARIFAKAINCQTPTSDGEACNHCESCDAFNEQRSYNIFELDAASNNSVENIKSLMEQTRIPPQVGKYKVFIIDEVHMLSTAAFNAFLKTLEEPPAHVIFILATTEKHKILPTIISRCQIYDFERMTVPGIVEHLKMVAQKEGVSFEEEALAVIAEKADGGMRDALSIFDQAASFCQGNITYQSVIADLNILDSDNYFNIIDLATENRVADIMVLVDNIIAKGFDGGNLINGLATHVRNVLMSKDDATLPLLEVSQRQKEKFKQQAAKCKTTFLYRALELMNNCDIHYRQSSNKRLLVELTLIQVAQITQADDDASASGRSPKHLKSLFKNIATPQNKPAVKVAGEEKTAAHISAKRQDEATTEKKTAVAENISVTNKTANPATSATASTGATPPPGARLKLDAIGIMLGNKQQTTDNNDGQQAETEPENKGEAMQFSQEDLELQWMMMCNRMPKDLTAMAARMKNITPKITEHPKIELLVDNEIMLEEINKLKKRIRATLAQALHNSQIELCIRLAKMEEMKKLITPRETLENIRQSNAAFERLRNELDLDLA